MFIRCIYFCSSKEGFTMIPRFQNYEVLTFHARLFAIMFIPGTMSNMTEAANTIRKAEKLPLVSAFLPDRAVTGDVSAYSINFRLAVELISYTRNSRNLKS